VSLTPTEPNTTNVCEFDPNCAYHLETTAHYLL